MLFLKENNIKSYIKLQTHEKMKTKAYQNDIGKYYNMTSLIYENTHYYRCADNRILEYQRTETHKKDGFERTFEVYACSDCRSCIHKANCLYKYNEAKDANRNKVMKINEQWEALKMDSNQNIQSEEGVLNRQIRSIQTE
ncbi:hypothetical protein AN2V17_45750 [Vallitalea sp. AN17-2]|uniref:Uncharacterized protein n=1 Tax=Vallitalea maricola TaxID=3074433 RepID=A0ACB5URS6_9FIRM|nr:hypothetical protein AN2V17_45750 [Vallitalea sp. AN17-2]